MSQAPIKQGPKGLLRWRGKPFGSPFSTVFLLTRIATVAVFLGRAWQHLRWDAPYRDLFWDEKWMGGLVHLFGYADWNSYVTDPRTDQVMQHLIQATGWFYLLCAVMALMITRLGKPGRRILRIGGAFLIFLAALYTKEKFYFFGQFLEYTLQWSAPFFLAAFARQTSITDRQVLLLKVAIALTFVCHGLYAVGYSPRPELFQTMVINILGLGNDMAIHFLNLAGVLDFIFAAALFVPWRKINILALAYLTFWGFMTTIARVWAFVHWEFLGSGLAQWLHESVFRFPHFLLPLGLLIWLLYGKESNAIQEKDRE
ncbi:hypothetical protein [Flavilitoribacter nigricans]|uniref:Uncharacterized protein n=1 Tax=Flavilitoribacter nigricans (strain ATCC 23147 / DSM 23189 / NBRC 102662 / NCIMB 1420 / SS-2) TaxID=1122177 RepID=A0A2D0NK05_FLAN2|nr:hypothetical protein [Flavilitoribacter nigricans]PHN08539.1 hypothetical protein CRP01_01095 [Flavilitoribacter nigricans DSM 23189 = NBRC 102662]